MSYEDADAQYLRESWMLRILEFWDLSISLKILP
jgi:hypothetical protein